MNTDKTKIMTYVRIVPTPLKAEYSILEVIDDCFYLKQTAQLGRLNFEIEVIRRIQLG